MSVETWGMLSKSQEDNETVEEAIARIVAEHNNNAEAHLAEGQSLQSHKAAEILDHLIYSVKLANFERNLFNKVVAVSSFQSLDSFDIMSVETEFNFAGVWINTDTGSTDMAYIAPNLSEGTNVNWQSNPVSDLSFKFYLGGDHDIYFGIGDTALSGPGPFCGFKVHNGVLSACVWDEDGNNDVSEVISGITLTDFNNYHIEFVDGEGAKFYINGELEAELAYVITNPVFGRQFYLFMFNRTYGEHLEAFIKPFSYSESK
jgi:hypothetical protein